MLPDTDAEAVTLTEEVAELDIELDTVTEMEIVGLLLLLKEALRVADDDTDTVSDMDTLSDGDNDSETV